MNMDSNVVGPYRQSVSSEVKEQVNQVDIEERYMSLAGVKVS